MVQIVPATPVSDGAGVRLLRSIGVAPIGHIDPFLLFDEFGSENPGDYIGGFPPHPHRGFETVTYMLNGRMRHEDSEGNSGELSGGGVQWMTAGRGVVHSEMPLQEEGLMRGFQLWVNLPASRKMGDPKYRNIEPSEIPLVELDGGGRAKVIAGAFHPANGGAPIEGAVRGIDTKPLYFDISLPPQVSLSLEAPQGHTSLVYPFEGSLFIGPSGKEEEIKKSELAVLSSCGQVLARGGASGGRFLFLAAAPIGEPIARGGPFVMNTREEVQQAFRDFSLV